MQLRFQELLAKLVNGLRERLEVHCPVYIGAPSFE